MWIYFFTVVIHSCDFGITLFCFLYFFFPSKMCPAIYHIVSIIHITYQQLQQYINWNYCRCHQQIS